VNEFVDHILDLMKSAGPVRARKMFGAYGIYLQETIIGLVEDNILYLKVDDNSRHYFEELHLTPFVYQRKGKTIQLSFYQAPEEALDDHQQMKIWTYRALQAALRSRK
jgi:DNA transformation protein